MAVPYTKDWTSLSKLNPELEKVDKLTIIKSRANKWQLLPSLGGFKLAGPGTTVESLRALGANRPKSEPWPEVIEHDIEIPLRDGNFNSARVYSPANSNSEGKALLVCAFGGGWVAGRLEGEERSCRTWAKKFGGVAVSISYRWVFRSNLLCYQNLDSHWRWNQTLSRIPLARTCWGCLWCGEMGECRSWNGNVIANSFSLDPIPRRLAQTPQKVS